MLIDDFMPDWDFTEVHTIRIEATPEKVWRAIYDLKPEDVRIMGVLMGLRVLPAVLLRWRALPKRQSGSLIQRALRGGFALLDQEQPHELVLGAIGRFWQLNSGFVRGIASAHDFKAFADPGYARATMNFHLRPSRRHPGQVLLRTETRILIPDAAARHKFSRYWLIVYPGSAFIRVIWLRAIKRRAEANQNR